MLKIRCKGRGPSPLDRGHIVSLTSEADGTFRFAQGNDEVTARAQVIAIHRGEEETVVSVRILERFGKSKQRGPKPKVIDFAVANRIRNARIMAGISLTKLALKLGISKQALSQLELGVRPISPEMEKLILDTINLVVAERDGRYRELTRPLRVLEKETV